MFLLKCEPLDWMKCMNNKRLFTYFIIKILCHLRNNSGHTRLRVLQLIQRWNIITLDTKSNKKETYGVKQITWLTWETLIGKIASYIHILKKLYSQKAGWMLQKEASPSGISQLSSSSSFFLLGDASGLFWNGPLIWGRLSWRWDNFSSKYQLSWKIQQKTLFIPAIQLGADANNTVSSKRD